MNAFVRAAKVRFSFSEMCLWFVRSPARVFAAVIVAGVILWFLFVGETIRTSFYSDKYVEMYRRSSPWCWVRWHLNVHESCSRSCIRFGSDEWSFPSGSIVPYWRDPADGAILFSTWKLGSEAADLYLLMPGGRPQYHARIGYSNLIHFGGGDLGAGCEQIVVKRLGKQKFEFASREKESESMVVELPLSRK